MTALRQYIKGDRIIWTVILIVFMISLLSVYSSTGSLAYKNMAGNTMYYLFRQIKFILLGLVTIMIIHLIPFRYYNWFAGIGLFIAIPLLLYTLIYGKDLNDASRWLYIPGMGSRTFQPSEFAKVVLIMYIAKVLAVNQNNIKEFRGVFLKLIIAISLVCLLILPANLSTAVIIFAVAFILMFVGRVPARYLFIIIVTGITGLSLFLLVSNAMSNEGRISTWKNRIETYVSGEGDNFQANQAKVAIVRGGLLPNGPGTSTQRNLLPHPYSDFIFAIIIEEYGSIIGGILLIILYLWLLFRTGIIVRRSKSTFGAFLAFGLALGLVFQAFVNMGVTVGLLPVTGQTLPLVSMGGTSVIFTSISLGIILSVSWGVKKELDEEVQNEETAQNDFNEKEVHEEAF